MAADPARHRVRFDCFDVDLQAGELRRDGDKLKLQEKPFQLLAVLVESHGQVITREELRSGCPDRSCGSHCRW